MQGDYDVVFTGRLRPGSNPDAVLDSFCKRFGIGPDTGHAMLHAEKEIVIRSGVQSTEAYKLKEVLESFGMEVRLQALHAAAEGSEPDLELVPKGKGGEQQTDKADHDAAAMHLNRTGVECPKCGTRQPQAKACRKCGLIFAKYYQHAAKAPAGTRNVSGGARVSAAREAARKTATRRRNASLVNILLGVALLAIVAGLGYVYYSGYQF